MIAGTHVQAAARICADTLATAVERDWEVAAGELAWSCRRTLDHVVDAVLFYAVHLASRATSRMTLVRDGDDAATVTSLVGALPGAAAILSRICDEAPPGTRAFHPAGLADPSGFAAMGCDEILVHTGDIAAGLGLDFSPPPDLCAAVIDRLFPWAPDGHGPWETLCWANGRGPLPDHDRLDENWYWWCAPLDEWDGARKVRTAPPAWR